MKKSLVLTALLVLATAPAFAAKVFIDYDKDAELGKYKTFQYLENENSGVNDPLADKRIVEGLEKMLIAGGMQKVDADPDVLVTYTVTTKEEESYNTTATGFGYGYGGGWGRYGYGGVAMGSSTTTVSTWLEGTLIVDVWDAETKKMIWRGSASEYLKDNPEKRAKQLDKAYSQMLKKWEAMKADMAKK